MDFSVGRTASYGKFGQSVKLKGFRHAIEIAPFTTRLPGSQVATSECTLSCQRMSVRHWTTGAEETEPLLYHLASDSYFLPLRFAACLSRRPFPPPPPVVQVQGGRGGDAADSGAVLLGDVQLRPAVPVLARAGGGQPGAQQLPAHGGVQDRGGPALRAQAQRTPDHAHAADHLPAAACAGAADGSGEAHSIVQWPLFAASVLLLACSRKYNRAAP
jgi:hypothetical protein